MKQYFSPQKESLLDWSQ